MVALSRVYSGSKKNTPKRGNASALGWEGEHASSSDDTLPVLCHRQPCDYEKVALCCVLNPKQNSDTLKTHSKCLPAEVFQQTAFKAVPGFAQNALSFLTLLAPCTESTASWGGPSVGPAIGVLLPGLCWGQPCFLSARF